MTLRYGLGDSVAISTHTGYDGEIGVNTTTKTIHVFDGITEGGTPLAKLSESGGGGGGSQWVSTTTGIHTFSNVGIGTTTPRFNLEVGSVGSSGTSLHVNGDVRITGILSVGQGTITIDGNSNTVTATNIVVTNNITDGGGVGYATTGYVNNALVGYVTTGYVSNNFASLSGANFTGVVTATSFIGNGSQLSGVGELDITSSLFI